MLAATIRRKIIPGLLPFLLCLLTCRPVQGQDQDEIGQFIRSGIDNAHKLVKAYSNPLHKSLATDLNAGWITSGEAFEPGRFELRFFGMAAFVPAKDESFDVTQIGLNANVRPTNPASRTAPTFFGENQDGIPLDVYATRPDNGQQVKVASFTSPPGIGFQVAPIPMAQLTVGLVKKTEVMVRFIPEIRYSDNRLNLWGVGLKHNINQWIPGLRQLPFELTAAAGYTSFHTSEGVGVRPEAGVANPNPANYETQRVVFDTKAYSGSLVISKTFFETLNLYGGLNYSKGLSEAALAGTYPVTQIRQQPPFNREIVNYTDPINLDFDHGQMGLTGGLRLKLKAFSFNLAGTWAHYPSVSAGIGLGWN
jgi:hypothetical protein